MPPTEIMDGDNIVVASSPRKSNMAGTNTSPGHTDVPSSPVYSTAHPEAPTNRSSKSSSLSSCTSSSSSASAKRPKLTQDTIAADRDTVDSVINDSDSDSELSDLGATPPPPSPILRAMLSKNNDLECSCPGFCECTGHAVYPDAAPSHLGEWALSSLPTAVSAVRSTAETVLNDNNQVEQASEGAAKLLMLLDPVKIEPARTRRAQKAIRLARDTNLAFPPHLELQGVASAVEDVYEALRAWRQHRDFVRLWDSIGEAVRGNPDLLVEFYEMLPEKWRRWRGEPLARVWKIRRRELRAELEGE